MPTQANAPVSVITLGTAGGPRHWISGDAPPRAGIATCVRVGTALYVIDAGRGVAEQFERAGLHINDLRAVFVTHLHSDHTIDLLNLMLFGLMTPGAAPSNTIRIIGPGDRGKLPPISPTTGPVPKAAFPDAPTPGTRQMVEQLLRSHATDINDRVLDAHRPNPADIFQGEDIRLPPDIGFDSNSNPTPVTAPFVIYQDDLVTVSATLVEHPPMAPAFAFRFDAAAGSVTISGDTRPSANLVTLAQGTDLLLHEAIDFDWAHRMFGNSTTPALQAALRHHHASHTSPSEAGTLARQAGAKLLALHHLVPGFAHPSLQQQAETTFGASVLIPDDLDVIPVGGRQHVAHIAQEAMAQ